MMQLHNMRKPSEMRPKARVDLLAEAFRAGQEVYKAGLIALINARRRAKKKPPLDWPLVGASASELRWSEGSARLLRYDAPASNSGAVASNSGATAQKSKLPLLLVCSLINRPYILDLMPGRSVVERLLGLGRDVWLIDWGTPQASDDTKPLDYWSLDLLPRAAEEVAKQAGVDQVHVLGYCMGGTMALKAMGKGVLPAASLVSMATPVDFAEGGMLALWSQAPGFDPREITKVYGHAPPHLLQPAFKMLDPVGLATKLVHLEDKVEDDDFVRFFLAMETWLEDSVAFPGQAFTDWIQMYRDNSLDLSSVRAPILSLIAKEDYITPPASALAIEKKAPRAQHERIDWNGGHIGLATSGGALKKMWPQVADFLSKHDPQAKPIDKKRKAR
jgi:polyhydroxyalkanoate synthase